MRFGQNVLRMTSKKRVVQFSWKARCFSALKRIWGQFHDFENFGAKKSDLAKTCCAWPEKRVLYNFLANRTVFPLWRKFQASSRFWKLWFGQKVLRMTWKERFLQFAWKAHCFLVLERIPGPRDDFENFYAQKCDLAKTCCAWPEKSVFVQFSWKVHCFPVLTRISGQGDDFENFDAKKCDLAKKCCAWPEKSVLYNFHGRRTVFSFWREFQARVTILRTLTLQNAIWPKRAVHDLKGAFWRIS